MIVAAACRCARLAQPRVEVDGGPNLATVEAAEAFAPGEPDADERLAAVAEAVAPNQLAGEGSSSHAARQAAERPVYYAKQPRLLHRAASYARDVDVPDGDLADAVCEAISFEAVEAALATLEATR